MSRITKKRLHEHARKLMASDPGLSLEEALKNAKLFISAADLANEIFASHPALKDTAPLMRGNARLASAKKKQQ